MFKNKNSDFGVWGYTLHRQVILMSKKISNLFTVILAVGVKESSRFNNLFTGVNLLVVTYIVICGSFKSESHNWNINPDEVLAMTQKNSLQGFQPGLTQICTVTDTD